MPALIAILVLAGAAFFAANNYLDQKAEREKPKPTPEWVDTAPAEAAEELDTGPMVPEHLRWKLDPRWKASEKEGAEAWERAVKLHEWHENEGGDPIRLRREKEELLKILGPIIHGLEEMKLEYKGNTGVEGNLQKMIDRYSVAISGVLR